MKKFLIPAFVLCVSISIFAQEKTIEKSEFDTVYKNSFRGNVSQARREIRTSESIYDSTQQIKISANVSDSVGTVSRTKSKTVMEFVPNVGTRTITDFYSGSLNKKTETIRIGDKTYKRENDGEWAEITLSAPLSKPEITFKDVDNQAIYKFIGTEQFNNQTARAYTATETNKRINLKTNEEGLVTTTTKYWFAEDGRLLGMESKQESRWDKFISKYNASVLYELDPTLKLESPIK